MFDNEILCPPGRERINIPRRYSYVRDPTRDARRAQIPRESAVARAKRVGYQTLDKLAYNLSTLNQYGRHRSALTPRPPTFCPLFLRLKRPPNLGSVASRSEDNPEWVNDPEELEGQLKDLFSKPDRNILPPVVALLSGTKQIPSTKAFNILIRGFYNARKRTRSSAKYTNTRKKLEGAAWLSFKAMLACNQAPDKYTFSTLVNLCTLTDDFKGMRAVLLVMKLLKGSFTPDLDVLGSIITYGVQSNRPELAAAGLQAIRTEGLTPNIQILTNLIQCAANDRNWDAGIALWSDVKVAYHAGETLDERLFWEVRRLCLRCDKHKEWQQLMEVAATIGFERESVRFSRSIPGRSSRRRVRDHVDPGAPEGKKSTSEAAFAGALTTLAASLGAAIYAGTNEDDKRPTAKPESQKPTYGIVKGKMAPPRRTIFGPTGVPVSLGFALTTLAANVGAAVYTNAKEDRIGNVGAVIFAASKEDSSSRETQSKHT
ncbi:hypothetical protein YB2330_003703 [Saitoella coloradoensis]